MYKKYNTLAQKPGFRKQGNQKFVILSSIYEFQAP